MRLLLQLAALTPMLQLLLLLIQWQQQRVPPSSLPISMVPLIFARTTRLLRLLPLQPPLHPPPRLPLLPSLFAAS